jgi:toxin ParE1/3/4
MRVILAPRVENDLRAIGDYIALDNRKRARSFIRKLRLFAKRIGEHPHAHPEQAHLRPDMRRAVYGAHLIFYTVSDVVRIERILHSSRDVSAGLTSL